MLIVSVSTFPLSFYYYMWFSLLLRLKHWCNFKYTLIINAKTGQDFYTKPCPVRILKYIYLSKIYFINFLKIFSH